MASERNAPQHKRDDLSGLPSILDEHRESGKKARNELRAIRALGLTAIILGVVALALLAVKIFEGETAGDNASALLAAYKENEAASPAATASATQDGSEESPETTDESYEATDATADATAAEDANEHLADDGSVTVDSESGDYVQPDAPEVSALDEAIEKIIAATGEDGVIGILEIPKYDVELPIIGQWSYKLLKISICRYKGPDPLEDGNLVIIGHNYKSGAHFGILKNLVVGDELYLTNADTGVRARYEVYEIKSISADSFSALKAYQGDAGLTLLTCKDNGTNRLLVRCVQKAAS